MLSNSFFTPHACRELSRAFHLKVWQKQAMKQWSNFVDFNASKLFEVLWRAWKLFHSSLKSQVLLLFGSQMYSENPDYHHNTSNFCSANFYFHNSTKLMKLFNSFVFFFCFNWNFCACFLLLNYRTAQRKFWFVFVFFVKLWTQLTSHHDEMK